MAYHSWPEFDSMRDEKTAKRQRTEQQGFMGNKKAQVLNKNAAEQQITAEQLIREATERANVIHIEPKQDIIGEDELQAYQGRKRKEFENALRMNKNNMGTWTKYATFEASMKEYARARNVFERALQVEMHNTPLWLKYITFEQKEGFVNHARNLFDRVTLHLPRVDQFWYKYAYMEELLGNFSGARAIFERWMEYEPEDNGWTSFVKFEERCGEIDRGRRVMERYVSCHCTQAAFTRMCKFEERHGNVARTRSAYEKAIELLETELDEKFWIAFAQFEVRQGEHVRARAIFKAALEQIPKDRAEELYQKYVNFEKIHGGQEEIEDVVMQKRRFAYEETLKDKPRDYDTWFDYLRLEEQGGDIGAVRELYERAIAQFPPIQQKDYWRRYIYLWYNYAMFEEMQAQDYPKARKVYDTIMKICGSKKLSFAKLYHQYAEFELRRLNLDQARRIFGRGMGECAKPKLFQWYAALEMQLGNFDKCRVIYERFCETHATAPTGWLKYAEFEEALDEIERARFIYETAIEVVQDRPEVVWRAYIDLEVNMGELERARRLLDRLLEKSSHLRVWRVYAEFELDNAGDAGRMRDVLERGCSEFKERGQNESRAMLLEFWLAQERKRATKELKEMKEADIQASAEQQEQDQPDEVEISKDEVEADEWVGKLRDRQPKKKKMRSEDDGQTYMDYIFPDDSAGEKNLKILQAAQAWKAKKAAKAAAAAAAAS
ncbi:unnamed protein product [Amoebophrya sp. A25]|nr:unnamed protein product [Amoebophrya sp. A25]|eukprot:GSA25T00024249001.1